MSEKGYGIIRFSFPLAEHIMPEATIGKTTLQRELQDTGFFAEVTKRLMLPDSYELLGIYVEPLRRCWILLVESPDIPIVAEGADLPHCTPIYTKIYNGEELPSITELKRIDIERHDRILKVD